MRKYLDILVEQPNLPNQEFVNALDSAHSSGQINKSYYDTLGSNEQAMLLRNVDNFKRTNPNYNSNAQDDTARAATLQIKQDQGKITKDQAAKNTGSGEFFQAPKAATPPPATTTQPKPAATAPITQPAATAPSANNIQATPVDFNKQAGVMPVADTGIGKLSGGVSLSGGAGDYLTPSIRAELSNQSGGKFTADVGQNTQQLGYQQKFGNDTTGQLAVNRNAQGGMSAGVGAEKQLNKNWSATGGVSTPVAGKGDTQFNVGLKGQF